MGQLVLLADTELKYTYTVRMHQVLAQVDNMALNKSVGCGTNNLYTWWQVCTFTNANFVLYMYILIILPQSVPGMAFPTVWVKARN